MLGSALGVRPEAIGSDGGGGDPALGAESVRLAGGGELGGVPTFVGAVLAKTAGGAGTTLVGGPARAGGAAIGGGVADGAGAATISGDTAVAGAGIGSDPPGGCGPPAEAMLTFGAAPALAAAEPIGGWTMLAAGAEVGWSTEFG